MADDETLETRQKENTCSTVDGHKRAPKYTEKGLEEHLHRQMNVRRTKLSQLTAKTNKINALMKDNEDPDTVDDHLNECSKLLNDFDKANEDVLRLLSPDEKEADQTYWFLPKREHFSNFMVDVEKWTISARQQQQDDVGPDDIASMSTRQQQQDDVGPDDSVSIAAAPKKRPPSSCISEGRFSSCSARSKASSTSSARHKEQAERAALLAKAASLKAKQALEMEELKLKAKKEQLEIETAIAASTAKIKVLEEWKCIDKSLKCNGDQDCEGDGLDERDCPTGKFIICENTIPPPNIQQIGLGYDAVTEKRRGSVINTNSFGGQCRPTYSGDHKATYRLPLSIIQYSFVVKVQTDFSDETFTSKWHYAKDIVERETAKGTTSGFRNYDFHVKIDKTQTYKLLVLKNDVEVAQFQSNSPKYIPISEEFWKALEKLPTVYDYSEYRKILERFGTHYVAEGSLGGSFKVIISIDEETENFMFEEKLVLRECERTKRWILFIPFTVEKCKEKDGGAGTFTKDFERSNNVDKVFVDGGSVPHIEALKRMDLKDPKKNWDMYSNWAESVRSFPQIINQKLRLLSELVKEVKCAGVKRVYLRRAIEQYLTESHPCHCQPCRNNGLVVMDGDECKCICKHGTKGLACEEGTEAEGQQGVIHGSWSCWSAWSLCTRTGNRLTHSRTRSCSNPFPQNGGQHCIGEPIETSECDDDELQYLKTMEPECFDDTLQPSPKCDTPLPLINGYIRNPKDVYIVGNRVEYSCTAGFHLVGQSILECTSGKTWSDTPGQCARSMCRLNSLPEDVIASPFRPFYSIGQSVVLSCPKGRILEGEATIICNPSLNFSPDPREIRCIEDENPEPTLPTVECKRWEKPYKGKCICISTQECGPSLELCATPPGSSSFLAITVCKMHVLQCMEKHVEIADYNSCRWGQRTTTDCTGCKMWETCDDQANVCRCKNSAECSIPGIQVCVRVGEDASAATQTMSECEAGLRRCKGEKVSVVSIHPCAS